ncbi:hypothetical protein G6L37_00950 [Agrobacterium rubi]|nr:hypothetical protein [Agrobacterium rubi]NTF23959.1 hypothetical protein [Agrobacterium rubi]
MSLDVYLKIDGTTVYDDNITHNLTAMADAAGCYEAMWRPDEIGITKAGQLVEPLKAGLMSLVTDPTRFETMNPPNGWGSYDALVEFVTAYLKACTQNPDAEVAVWR